MKNPNNIKYVSGIGICDIPATVNGKRLPAYQYWTSMLTRCTSYGKAARFDTYKGCTVSKQWLLFSEFKKWFDLNHKEHYDLDKDILVPGNKVYGPDTCRFVPHYINLLINSLMSSNKFYPGVSYKSDTKSYQVFVKTFSSQKYLGLHPTPEAASQVYRAFKAKHIRRVAYWSHELGHIDEEVYGALLIRARLLETENNQKRKSRKSTQ